MRFAYADPPYMGCAKRYAGGVDVNHRLLIGWLETDFDGWALSCHAPSLREIAQMMPEGVRVMAWTKRFVPHRPNVRPTYAWEPVIVKPMKRRTNRCSDTPFDWLLTEPGGFRRGGIGKQRILGEKPPPFVSWLLKSCKVQPDDEIVDVFPGSGAVGEAIDMWRRQQVLPLATPGESR